MILPGSAISICKTACNCRAFRLILMQNISITSSSRSRNFVKDKLTHYQILGVEKDASSDDIRSAFIRLSKHYHPDINAKDPQNHDKFVGINEAYSVLSRPLLRKEYDNELVYRLKGYDSHYPRPENFYDSPFYDAQFYANRDKSQDAYYASKPFYGVKGISKVSNQSIVSICVAVIVLGAAFHFFVVKKLSDIHIENLNARDRKSHRIWVDANDPENNSELLRLMKKKVEEEEGKKSLKESK